MTFLIGTTIVSMVIALVMSVVAWRMATEERRRSDARVTALAAEIHHDLDLRSGSVEAMTPQAMSTDLFAAAQAASGSRLATIVAFGVIVVGSIATVGLLLGEESRRAGADAAAVDASAPDSTRGAALPLELVALGHERDDDRLTVRGVVRNPQAGAAVDGLTAVVFVFGTDGNFITSGRSDIDSARLGPGGESRFVVTVPAADVGRYRVSFRTDDRIVPHVDRREPPLARK